MKEDRTVVNILLWVTIIMMGLFSLALFLDNGRLKDDNEIYKNRLKNCEQNVFSLEAHIDSINTENDILFDKIR